MKLIVQAAALKSFWLGKLCILAPFVNKYQLKFTKHTIFFFFVIIKHRLIWTNLVSFMAVHHPMQMSLLAGNKYTRFIREMLNPKYLLASSIGSQWLLLTSVGSSWALSTALKNHFTSPEERNCLLWKDYLSPTSLISSHCSYPLNMPCSPKKDYLQHWEQDRLQ